MAGVSYYSIEEIPEITEDTKIITIGTVIAISKQQKFLSFNISDSTATAEATAYQQKSSYSLYQLPKIGDTIQVLGSCFTKPMADPKQKPFMKIKMQRWRVISFEQELQLIQTIMVSRSKRRRKKLQQTKTIVKRKVPVKERTLTTEEMVDIRSLILSYLYIVFQSNSDIQSYLFCPIMVRSHSLCKDYMQEKQLHEKSMEEAISQALSYLLTHQIIEQKPIQPGQMSSSVSLQQFVIKKRFFERLIVDIEEYVYEKKSTGTQLNYVTSAMNKKMGNYKEEDYLFNFKFIQKVLTDLIQQFRIYKTSNKKIYPYKY